MKGELINMTWVWDKERSESPMGIKPITSRTPDGLSIHWATRLQGEHCHLTVFICDRRTAYCYDWHCQSHHERHWSTWHEHGKVKSESPTWIKVITVRNSVFLCPMLAHIYHIYHFTFYILSHFITELKIHHLY